MRHLDADYDLMERHMPGFIDSTAPHSFASREAEGSSMLRLFKQSGGVDLAIPQRHGGKGLSPSEMVRIQRVVGSLSPSLAVATTMHQFSVATLVEMARVTTGPESMVLQAIAEAKMYVASAFAEGRSGSSILEPFLKAERRGDAFIVNGSKKPCSLSKSMDLITVSITVNFGGDSDLAVALLPADAPGIVINPFWRGSILKAAESEEVVFRDVQVSEQQISYSGSRSELDIVQFSGFIWFELLLTAGYLGMCSRLMSALATSERTLAADLVFVTSRIECGMHLLTALADRFVHDIGGRRDLLGHVLMARYLIQDLIDAATGRGAEALGGMRFIADSEVSYLLAATKAIAFHPPSRNSMLDNLSEWTRGRALSIC